jgi:energy-coupling factor transporter ATP-binding protein EcfA2
VHFSAKLRLEETDPAVNDGSIDKFVDQTLAMLELTNLRDLQVGDDDTGGLSFEQTKRLSIAVELASNPSILFLDEPTSGLDARAAAIVMRGMRRVANSGRAVCATIHQPSVAIFNYFDSLLLLKRGGETVFFGGLGKDSCELIKYLESYEATPTIQPGENPATWMLTTIGAGSAGGVTKPFDYAGSYAESELHVSCLREIDTIVAGASEKAAPAFPHKYATSTKTQSSSVMRRMMTLYYRCPSYNTVRQMICALVALLFASVYAANRVPSNESDMNSRYVRSRTGRVLPIP